MNLDPMQHMRTILDDIPDPAEYFVQPVRPGDKVNVTFPRRTFDTYGEAKAHANRYAVRSAYEKNDALWRLWRVTKTGQEYATSFASWDGTVYEHQDVSIPGRFW